jgi:hypothetical protein
MSDKPNPVPAHGKALTSGGSFAFKLPEVPPYAKARTIGEYVLLKLPESSTPYQSLFKGAMTNDALTVSAWSASNSSVFSDETKLIERRISELLSPASPASLFASAEKSLEERLFDATASVKILTAQVAMHLDREWRNKLFAQLDSLHDLEEWDPDDEPIQTGSFATFLKAMVQIKPQRRPGLGLSHNGYLVGAWTVGKNRLTIEFLQNDRVRWVLARYTGDDVERFAGQTSVSRLIDGLAPYNPDAWFSK